MVGVFHAKLGIGLLPAAYPSFHRLFNPLHLEPLGEPPNRTGYKEVLLRKGEVVCRFPPVEKVD
ncbi:MAG: hypothetical protein AB7F31_01505 [Parachlamydiales bacterium]